MDFFIYLFASIIILGYILPKFLIYIFGKVFELTPNFFALFLMIYLGLFYFYLSSFRGPAQNDIFGVFLTLPFILSGFYIGYRWVYAKDKLKEKKG